MNDHICFVAANMHIAHTNLSWRMNSSSSSNTIIPIYIFPFTCAPHICMKNHTSTRILRFYVVAMKDDAHQFNILRV